MKTESIIVSKQSDLNSAYCPLPLSVIPNNMGINLCSVESIHWTTRDDGQLLELSIKFIPDKVGGKDD